MSSEFMESLPAQSERQISSQMSGMKSLDVDAIQKSERVDLAASGAQERGLQAARRLRLLDLLVTSGWPL